MENREIANYIKEKFPNSCIAVNENELGHQYDEDQLLDELIDFVKYELLGLCGCGDNESCCRDVRNLLRAFSSFVYEERHGKLKEYFNVDSIYDNSLLEFMVYTLNSDNKYALLEHGTSISGSWLTEIGKYSLFILEQMNLDNDD